MSNIHVPPEATVLAMDVHKRSISTAVLEPDSTTAPVDRISTDQEAVLRLIRRFDDPSRVWACYEAGSTGYELARVLRGAGMHCEVIAPSLIPTAPGTGSRPTSATPAGSRRCSGAASSPRSGFRPRPRRRHPGIKGRSSSLRCGRSTLDPEAPTPAQPCSRAPNLRFGAPRKDPRHHAHHCLDKPFHISAGRWRPRSMPPKNGSPRFQRVEPPLSAMRLDAPISDLVGDTSDAVSTDRTLDDRRRCHVSVDRDAQYPGRRRSWAMART